MERGLEGSERLPMEPGWWLTSCVGGMPSTVRIQVGEGLENLGVLHVGGGSGVET